ncbi:MAG: cytochrome c-type biogenesis protein CcmH [Pseudomonadaceae bacterium]|jgi:cytochrome c-type biogenesis protein CcmH|nr:cytochrome c-type biogenesis protein CcmH [Pseudomonadaceae bacterium]
MNRLVSSVLCALLFTGVAHAAIDTYEFTDQASRERFGTLIKELRCPKCQNQDLADSNAPIAMDLRREIYRMLQEGQSDEQIVEYLVSRYGEFVRYKPALTTRTLILWYGPAGLLSVGAMTLLLIVRRRRRYDASKAELSLDERERLASLLNSKSLDSPSPTTNQLDK